MDDTMTCGTCGRVAAGDDLEQARVSWTYGVERGQAAWTCPACSRLHSRSIEGKLDSEWW